MATEPTETIRLRNGAEEAKPLVAVMQLSLERLLRDKPGAFLELVALCRDPEHTPWGRTGDDLVELELADRRDAETYTVHQSVRNIVLASVEGDGMDMRLVSPVATGGR